MNTKTQEYLDSRNIDYVVTADGKITINDNLTIPERTDVVLDDVETIIGSVDVRQGATFTAPALVKSGYVDVQQGATFTAPALVKSGSVDVRQGATFTAPALVKSGSVDVRQGATFTAPALKDIEEVRLEGEFLGEDITVIDGIGCVTLSTKGKDGRTIRSCRKSTFKKGKLAGEKFYVASRGKDHAHGKTMREALQELQFKTGTRNIDQYRNLPLTMKKKPDEWAFIYRMVTGACQYGVKSFISSKGKIKKAYTLAEILVETKGAYGSNQFRSVVCGRKAA